MIIRSQKELVKAIEKGNNVFEIVGFIAELWGNSHAVLWETPMQCLRETPMQNFGETPMQCLGIFRVLISYLIDQK